VAVEHAHPRGGRARVAVEVAGEVHHGVQHHPRAALASIRVELLDLRAAVVAEAVAFEHGVVGVVAARVAARVEVHVMPVAHELVVQLVRGGALRRGVHRE
jgi:hypothetical protein